MADESKNVSNSMNNKASSNNPGFTTALYIDLPSYENKDGNMREAIDGIENLKLGSSDFLPTPTITPRVSDTYKNYISSDLLKRLEESSPIKSQKSMEFRRKISDISLLNVENKNEDEGEQETSPENRNVNLNHINHINPRLSNLNRVQKLEEESKRDHNGYNNSSNEKLTSHSNNFKTRNFKLKNHMMNNKVVIDEEEEQENYEQQSRENFNSENENMKNNFNQNFQQNLNNANNNYDLYNNVNNNMQGNNNNNFEEPQSLFMGSMNFDFNNQNMNMNNYNMNHIGNQNTNFMNANTANSKKNSIKNNSNNLNSSQNYYSPPYQTKQAKHVRKDSSPLYTYYDGTAECLSQTFYDEFKKSNNEKFMSTHNFIKKSEQVNNNLSNLSNQNNFSSLNNNNNSNNINNQQDETSYLSSGSVHSLGNTGSNNYTKTTDDQSTFNSFQLPPNYFNGRFLNINNFGQNFENNLSNNNTNNNFNKSNNINNISNMNSNFNNMTNNSNGNFNMNSNFGNPHRVFGNENNLMDFSNSSIDGSMGNVNQLNFMNSSGNMPSVKRNNMRPGTFPNNQMNHVNNNNLENPDEYMVEMFGRKGWICEMCNNFNYETRQKCNRCGVTKSPKKIKSKMLSQKMNGSDMKLGDSEDLDDSMERKKKRPFVERVGDWVCIKCKNLNFSFRVVCNRCQLPKTESDKMFESYMSNLMNYVKVNEIMQQNILQGGQGIQGGQGVQGQINQPPNQNLIYESMEHERCQFAPGTKGYVNNNSINVNNNYYNNYPNTKNQNYIQALKNQGEYGFNHGGIFSGMSNNSGINNVGNSGIMSMPFQMVNNNVEEDEDYYNENEEN